MLYLLILLGVVWMSGYQWVFVAGAIIALLSFLISLTIDTKLHQRLNGVTELQKEVI
ncbi:hypothetical protein ACED56_06770 [Vibrio splendidus]|uniref:hypothetical protein n=1 Tax=Vibrio splendidus TaxID=29497 RepID=UPI00352DB4FA